MPLSNEAFRLLKIRSAVPPWWLVIATACVLVFLCSCSPPTPIVESLPKYDIQIVVNGTRRPSVLPRESFRVSSGQVNVGCGESANAEARFQLPGGATEVQSIASWQHTDNVRNQFQSVIPAADGVVRATGTIFGRDKELFNCPGGGHGELVLEGSYKPAAPDQGTLPILKTVHDQVAGRQPLLVILPIDAAVTPSSCDVVVLGGGSSSRATITFGIDAQGKLTISQIAPNSTPPIDASLKDNVLTISVLGK